MSYLEKWETGVASMEGHTKREKNRMLLSPETLLGLRMTSMLTLHYLDTLRRTNTCHCQLPPPPVPLLHLPHYSTLTHWPGVLPLHSSGGEGQPSCFPKPAPLSRPTRNGCQRQRGGTSDNPNVREFYKNAAALRVVNSFCWGPEQGNCRGAGSSMLTDRENTPLLKRNAHKH